MDLKHIVDKRKLLFEGVIEVTEYSLADCYALFTHSTEFVQLCSKYKCRRSFMLLMVLFLL